MFFSKNPVYYVTDKEHLNAASAHVIKVDMERNVNVMVPRVRVMNL